MTDEKRLFTPKTVQAKPDGQEQNARRLPVKCNELDGRTWLQHSISVWDDIRKTAEEQRLKHPAMFPAMLVQRLIRIFLRSDQKVVLDPFVGSGSTVVGALQEGKTGIGLDASPEYVQIARERCRSTRTLWEPDSIEAEAQLHVGDARSLLRFVPPDSVDLCITSPPYWNILNRQRTADYKDVRHYGNREADLGTIDDYREFIAELSAVFRQVFLTLRPKSYCVVVVMDLRKKDRFFPFHMDVAGMMQEIGFLFDDTIIWDRKSEYNNLRPLGYPSVFRVNKIHEFILLFRTPAADEKSERDAAIRRVS